MDLSPLFCSGIELAKLAVSSGLLSLSWTKISELNRSIDLNQESNLRFQIYQEDKYTVVAFVAPPICTRKYLYKEGGSVNSASSLLSGSSRSNLFQFLCSTKISSFSVHSPALQLFASLFKDLSPLKSQLLDSEKPVVVTGAELGGSVGSLFTLWLLDTIEPGKKCPLCITFGSPLIGDTSLNQILQNSVRNSCFLHVAATQDPVPKLLISQARTMTVFKPFGTFLFCCGSEFICIEDPDAVLELLNSINGDRNFNHWRIYDDILQRMERFSGSVSDNFLDEMLLQTDQMGVIHGVIMRMEERAKKKLRFDPFKKLNNMKINMAQLEWYKKICRTNGIGYYDHFKNHSSGSQAIATVEKYKKELTDYWKAMVEEVEKKPQSEIAVFKRRFLFASNNYRRMIEPLDIAEYYRNGFKNYTANRSSHYILLQKWFEQADLPVNGSVKMKNRINILTLDSCFWAQVEEAIIAMEKSEERELMIGKLEEFERYVWELIGKYSVSPEIFLAKSSFMRWWRQYKTFKGITYRSHFTHFMNNGTYLHYGSACQ